jgi:transposase-like protein
LTPSQQAAALALAAGGSAEEAAAAAGVNPRTVKRWRKDVPGFQAFVNALRYEATDRVMGQLVGGMLGAAATLRQLSQEGTSEGVRLRASVALLEQAARLRDDIVFEWELADLRKMIGELERAREHPPPPPWAAPFADEASPAAPPGSSPGDPAAAPQPGGVEPRPPAAGGDEPPPLFATG